MADDWKEDIIKNKLGGKREWTDEERAELCHQLDKDLNSHLDSVTNENVLHKDGWTEENWKEKMAEHPIFSPYVQEETKGEAPISVLSEGLAQLKYAPEHNTPSEMAQSYKEEGVNHFKYKKYRFAIASFTAGLRAKSPDQELNAQLYNNRAAAHFHLQNYRSSIKDCQKAVELKPDYMKAIQRGIQSAISLKCWDEVIEWCDKGLLINSSSQDLVKQRASAIREKQRYNRDTRKKAQEMKQQLNEDTRLLNEIAKRGIKIGVTPSKEDAMDEDPHQILLRDLEPDNPSAKQSPVHLNGEGELVWPVLFLYPEHNESDVILEFNENSRFTDHLDVMFGPECDPPSWDSERKYKPHNFVLFFEDRWKKSLVNVALSSSLKESLAKRSHKITAGTPTFLVLVNDSAFMEDFVDRYSG